MLGDGALEGEIAALTDVERPRDGGCHQRGIGERREIDEGQAALEARREILRRLDGEARLARAAWSRQRHQPHAAVGEQLLDARELSGSPEERRALRRKVVAAALRRSAWSAPARVRLALTGGQLRQLGLDFGGRRPLASGFSSIEIRSRSSSGGIPGSSSRGLRTAFVVMA